MAKSRAQQIAKRRRRTAPAPAPAPDPATMPAQTQSAEGPPWPGGVDPYKGDRELGLGVPGTPIRKSVRQERQRLRGQGVRGKDLRSQIQDFRQKAKGARQEDLMKYIPEAQRPWVKNPYKWLKSHGKQPFGRLAGMQSVSEQLGLTDEQKAFEEHLAGQLNPDGTPKVNFREEEEPIMSQMEGYIGERLGKGFTPEERAAYYGSMHDPLMAQSAEANENQRTKLAAAGIDPRSGVANARAQQIQAATQRGLAEAGRQTEQANLERKKQIEGYAQDMGALEERKRSGMVESELGRLGKIEEGMAGAS